MIFALKPTVLSQTQFVFEMSHLLCPKESSERCIRRPRGSLTVVNHNKLKDRGDGPSEMFFDRARQIEPRDRSNSLDGLLKLGEWSAVAHQGGDYILGLLSLKVGWQAHRTLNYS